MGDVFIQNVHIKRLILMFETFSKDAKIVIGKIVPLKKGKKMKEGAKISNHMWIAPKDLHAWRLFLVQSWKKGSISLNADGLISKLKLIR